MHAPVVLGLDFGGTKIAAAVCDLTGARLGTVTVSTVPGDGARPNLERGITTAQTLLEQIGRPLIAVGACTFGIPREDGVDLAPAIPGWDQLALGRELGRAFGEVPVQLGTDVKAAAQAEAQWGALVGCDPGIYLNLGTGLAAAVVVNGIVLNGRNGAAGEIGYSLRNLLDVGRAPVDRVALEEAVSGMALIRTASVMAAKAVTAAQIFAEAPGDRQLAGLLADFVAELAFHLVNLAIAIDPARIVVGGGMTAAWDHLHDGLRRALDAAVPYPPELVLAEFPFEAPLLGALSLGLAAVRAQGQHATGPTEVRV